MRKGNPRHPVWLPDRSRGMVAPVELEARSESGNGSAQRFLHLPEGCLILVALSGPEEAFETILAMTGHEVDMHMGDVFP
jgi:hypothetical protein